MTPELFKSFVEKSLLMNFSILLAKSYLFFGLLINPNLFFFITFDISLLSNEEALFDFFDKCLLESAQYLENRRRYLIDNIPNINIVFRVGKSPDEDILFCKNAKHFISTGGGFGKLLKEIL